MRNLAIAAALLGLVGVALGAFGAHGLKSVVSPDRLEVWQTAVSYQMYHAPVLLLLAWIDAPKMRRLLNLAACSMLGGIVIFSGTLYLLVLLDLPKLGMITPVGGTLLIIGWLFLVAAAFKGWPDKEVKVS